MQSGAAAFPARATSAWTLRVKAADSSVWQLAQTGFGYICRMRVVFVLRVHFTHAFGCARIRLPFSTCLWWQEAQTTLSPVLG